MSDQSQDAQGNQPPKQPPTQKAQQHKSHNQTDRPQQEPEAAESVPPKKKFWVSKEDKQRSELQKIEQQCQEYLQGWQRAQADYQNLQRESTHKQQELQKFAGTETLRSFLPLVDYFNYAFAHEIPQEYENSHWLQGIKHIQTYLLKILSDYGVEQIKTVGEKFNPELHEAVAEVEDDEVEPETIVAEVSAGFKQHGKVIQVAKVKVAKQK